MFNHLTMYSTVTASYLLALFIFFFINVVESRNLSEDSNDAASVQNSSPASNFQPSLAVVIGMLSIMFAITFILLLYAKFCHRESSLYEMNNHIRDGLRRSRTSLVSGLDKTVIESLPVFRFSSLRGSREGLECAVCLAKFEDVEILRLLPKCKHAFHIDCIDQWLEKHSTCPLCRQKVGKDDVSELPYSNSLRFLWSNCNNNNNNNNNNSRLSDKFCDESNIELYVQREENSNTIIGSSSSRFSVGSSFRKMMEKGKNKREEELPMQQSTDDNTSDREDGDGNNDRKSLHKLNHRIVASDVVFKNRWSNVSSSDLMFLNSEMLNDMSSARFNTSLDLGDSTEMKFKESDETIMNIKEEMERKRLFESKVKEKIQQSDHQRFRELNPTTSDSKQENNPGVFESSVMNPNDKIRCMSEIVVHPRFTELNKSSNIDSLSDNHYSNNTKDERRRRLWLPIARKTVRWFANREIRRPSTTANSNGLNYRIVV